MGLERGPLSLVSTTEELLGRNNGGSGLKNREYGRGDPLRWPRDTLHPQNLPLTWPTSGGRSVGIVCSRTKPTEFSYNFNYNGLHPHSGIISTKRSPVNPSPNELWPLTFIATGSGDLLDMVTVPRHLTGRQGDKASVTLTQYVVTCWRYVYF
jgi:hypothetical protein